MTGLDQALHEALTHVADDEVHVERLLAGARAAGTRYRRRRSVVTAGAGVSVGAVVVAVVLTVALNVTGGSGPELGPGSPAATRTSSPSAAPADTPQTSVPPMAALPTPPVAAGAATAADSATEVGQPLLLHLSLAPLPFTTIGVQYQQLIDERQERLGVDIVDGNGQPRHLTVRVGADTEDFEPLAGRHTTVHVAGRTGTFAVDEDRDLPGVLRWRAANGLWLQVADARDQNDALMVAAAVRLDRTFRCVAPYRLRSLPAGTKVSSCSVVFRGATATSLLGVTNGTFHILFDTMAARVSDANEQIGGRPARVSERPGDGGARIMEVALAQDGAVLSLTASGHYDPTLMRRIAAECDWTGGHDPTTWPIDPLQSG